MISSPSRTGTTVQRSFRPHASRPLRPSSSPPSPPVPLNELVRGKAVPCEREQARARVVEDLEREERELARVVRAWCGDDGRLLRSVRCRSYRAEVDAVEADIPRAPPPAASGVGSSTRRYTSKLGRMLMLMRTRNTRRGGPRWTMRLRAARSPGPA